MSLLDRILGRTSAPTIAATEKNPMSLESVSYEDRRAALATRKAEITDAHNAEKMRAEKIVKLANAKHDADVATAEAAVEVTMQRAASVIIAELWRDALPLVEAYVLEPTRRGAATLADLLARTNARCLHELGAELWGTQVALLFGSATHDERAISVLGVDDPFFVEAAGKPFKSLGEPAAFATALLDLETLLERRMANASTPPEHVRARFDLRKACATTGIAVARCRDFDADRVRLAAEAAARNHVDAPNAFGRSTRVEGIFGGAVPGQGLVRPEGAFDAVDRRLASKGA